MLFSSSSNGEGLCLTVIVCVIIRCLHAETFDEVDSEDTSGWYACEARIMQTSLTTLADCMLLSTVELIANVS